jgi:hypothetical protein
MKRKNQNPYNYSLQHTQDRAFQRYGYNLTRANYDELTKLVRDDIVRRCFPEVNARYEMVNQEGAQYTLIVPFAGRTFVVVFDANRALVTTLLPPSDFADQLHI